MNDRGRGIAALCCALWLALIALPFVVAAARAAPSVTSGPILICPSAQLASACRPIDLDGRNSFPRDIVLARRVEVPPRSAPPSRQLMVWLIAMASSEVRWNGVLIGRNGMPGPDAAHERPGRFIASVAVPPELVHPGRNDVTVTLSSHHLWLPVRRTVHAFEVLPYEPIALPGLSHYLPALLMLGGLAATGLFFGAARLLDRGDRAALLLAAVSGLALLQLAIETSRSFILYPYPWHLLRVGALAFLAAANAVLIALYAARRLAPDWQRATWIAALLAGSASLLLIPWYDIKALAALSAGFLLVLACAALGWKRRLPAARFAAGIAILFFILLAWQRTEFLDRAWYILLSAMLIALAAEQLLLLREARRGRDSESLRADALEARLAHFGRGASGTALLKDGSRMHRVPEEEICFARAADDYSEVVLRDGRVLLVTMNLARLVQALSPRFVRIHKSYVINAGALASVGPRPRGGREAVLIDGSRIPVGRSYGEALSGIDGR